MLNRILRTLRLAACGFALATGAIACADPMSASSEQGEASATSGPATTSATASATPVATVSPGTPTPGETAGPNTLSAASERAEEMCNRTALPRARENGEVIDLTAAHPSTIADFIKWQESPPPDGGPYIGESRYRYGYDPDEFIAYCYVDGEFSGIPMAPRSPGEESDREIFYRRVGIVVLASGEVTLYTAGWPDTLSLEHAPGFTPTASQD